MITSADRRIARNSLLLSKLEPEMADAVLDQSREVTFERGAALFLQGETADCIHIVVDGWVKLYRIAPNGAEAVVCVFTRGQSFGEALAFQKRDYPVAAEAVTEARVILVPARVIAALIRETPELAMSLLAATFVHLHGLVSQVEQLKAQTGAQRVAEFLLELCPVEEGACTVTLPYDKVLIAGRLGIKPESLSRAFARLKEHGVSVRKNHAAIRSVGGLRAFAESDPAEAWSKAL
ncbi:Crp/Fnr family transcriptional regulator [Defluviimonas sp. WL0024]|uniref:Crp/Fnr family transcriptional regulator n=2 Tax=Albidovulum TaxID=205889 RepID=A0ABT3J9F0_9RHOB|nr:MULTISPECIES: Crp/Fnr family transcriptional regulator [Defluviimonas]MCU9848821.1 Crp/Fnr family transcriptional regulator [Defluviimonas sp. WL0024]MCW3784014.1 Crp/Fnr family transcriptional regulator [Defluviimonas salinarum]